MRRSPALERVAGNQIGMAAVLLLGVLLMAGGWFQLNRLGLTAGLLVTLAGVMAGIVAIVAGRRGSLSER
jgi:hypothetical protein